MEPKADRASREVPRHFDRSVVAARKAIERMAPSGKPEDIVAAFGGKTSWGVIRAWRDGRRHIPQWARDMIRDHAMRTIELLDEVPRGPGQRAGDKNLIRRWRT